MYLVIKTVKPTSTSATTQRIQACATDLALEEYITAYGLTDTEVYEAKKLEFNITWKAKERRNVDE